MSLYTDLGGAAGIAAALDRFYAKVLADPELSVFFEGVNMDVLKRRQRAFFTMAFGGPDAYEGRALRTAHRRPRERGLDEDRFERFMDYFRETLAELGAPPEISDQVMAIAYAGKDEVLAR